MLIEILGLVFSMIVGTIGHFLYEFSNKNKLLGFLFAKGESIWEHIKLGVTPILLWIIIELLTYNFNCIFFVKFISVISFIVLLLVSYYLYKYFFKKNNIFFDILLFYICLSLSYIISIKLLISIDCDFILNAVGFIGICSIIYLYFKFNKKTPDLIIFQEP